MLVALRTELLLRSTAGVRHLPVDDFFLRAERPDLRPGEFLSEIVVPAHGGDWAAGYYKLKFAESSWPVVTTACLLPPPSSRLS
ncbi:FAD binding domain-containing protein [Saccharopolyspora phatthalungensis]|uniref:CO/xanthine dehydrogenase FAD-binding subunit n=1 Tax=Saccharopolyspora phatthalungensis TaxID=664693 RepID=A0A840QJE9_9PSEU|nr:FAD binding domain-containing protein [Saccharopolyspora phatthalungensis]MBB5159025.1 CO/xanthine dehydrogenase FAD-binding subunit [Saccharopolyspora phatthalungensis]